MPLPDFESAEDLDQQGAEGEAKVETESLDDKLTKVQQSVQTTVQQGLQQNQQLVSLLADPDVQEVLRRKQQGQKFQITDPAAQDEPEPNFEEMDQKQLVAYLGKQNQKLVASTVQDVLQPLVQQMTQMQGVVRNTQEEKAVAEVQAAAQKFSDFDKYRPVMVQLAQRNVDATPEELYVMAAMRAGKQPQLRAANRQREQTASSERPSHTTARPGKPIPKNLSPRESFNFSLQNALKNIDTTGLEEGNND